MDEEDKMFLFMPLVSASLTNAVYTHQLLNKDNELTTEDSIRDVVLTNNRVYEVMNKYFSKNVLAKKTIAQVLLSEIAILGQKMKELDAKSQDQKAFEIRFLESQKVLLNKLMDALLSDQAK